MAVRRESSAREHPTTGSEADTINRSVRRTSAFVGLLFLALLANISYIQVFQAEPLRDDPRNARQYEKRLKVDRGPILAGEQRIAWSTKASRGRFRRSYLDGPVFAPVTGYHSLYSSTGLEKAQNDVLDGTDLRLSVADFTDRLVGEPTQGGAVRTTIDPYAQRVAYAALRASTDRRAAAVALDARTGAVLVMASYPSYDPADLAVFNTASAQRAFQRLQADRAGQPLLNKAINETFAPGSSFKAVVAAAALDSGMSPESRVRAGTSYTPPGAGRPIRNSHDSGSCGRPTTTLLDAFAQSCNTTFASLGAQRLGGPAVAEQAGRFGYDERIELAPGMSGVPSVFPDTDVPGTALASIGQGDNRATVLHMAMVAAGAANNGEVMRPYLVEEVSSRDGLVIGRTRERPLSTALDPQNAARLREMMTEVVRTGTATNVGGRDIAGKTGTADVDGAAYNERWFIGYGPLDTRRYAVAVITEGEGSGGSAAGPVAAEIITALREN